MTRRERSHAAESSSIRRRARVDVVVPAGEPWIGAIERGQTAPHRRPRGQPGGRHAVLQRRTTRASATAPATPSAQQGNLYLTTGTRAAARATGDALLTIVADTCGRHDTLGGACAAESNTVRYALDKRYMHACRDSFLLGDRALRATASSKRDITHNINFFMNVPVTPDGKLTFEDGISAPGKYVELRAEMDVLVPDLELPAAQQSLQRLQPDAGPPARSGTARAALTWSADVQQGPDRQPRRDRLPHHPHAARAWACARSRCTRRPTRTSLHVRAGGRGGRASARRRPRESYLRRRARSSRPRAQTRRAGDPSRLRLPERERGVRRGAARRRASRFIGPTPEQIRALRPEAHGARAGARARRAAAARARGLLADAATQARRAAERIGYPVMLKSTAGGGGIGMRVCADASELGEALRGGRSGWPEQLRRTRRLPREVRRARAPHRGADLRRRPRRACSRSASATARRSAATRR